MSILMVMVSQTIVTQMMMVMVSLIQIREITTDTGIMATDTDADITDVADTTGVALITEDITMERSTKQSHILYSSSSQTS